MLNNFGQNANISIHAPHTGGDIERLGAVSGLLHFNPRPPYGRRLRISSARCPALDYFNPRPPYGRRLTGVRLAFALIGFQSTPPIREATTDTTTGDVTTYEFQSTPPIREAT